jgi:hypothetical protein
MSEGAAVEAFLARVFVDPVARARFLADPDGEVRRAGLAPEDARALAMLDLDDLELAARSFARKRSAHPRRAGRLARWWQALRSAVDRRLQR